MDRCLKKNILPVGLPGSTGIHKDLPRFAWPTSILSHLTGSSKDQDCLVLLTLEASRKEVSIMTKSRVY